MAPCLTGRGVASGRADFGIETLPGLLAARDVGADLVSIAQVFARGRTWEDRPRGAGRRHLRSRRWPAKPENRDLAVRFLEASFLAGVLPDYPAECVRILHDRVPEEAESRQLRQQNEINALIWPNETGIGTMAPSTFQRTSQVAQRLGLIELPATGTAWRDDLALLAVTEGQDEEDERTSLALDDLLGTDWEKPTVGDR